MIAMGIAADQEREAGRQAIRESLRRRGFDFAGEASAGGPPVPARLARARRDRFYALFKRYSFRLFLRDYLLQDEARVLRGRRFYSAEKAAEYAAGMARIFGPGGASRVRADLAENMGGLFEWFVEEMLFREFALPALRGVRLRNSPVGGDLDLVALLEGGLLVGEIKSSPPKHIHQGEIDACIGRLFALRPRYALIVEDTHLRLGDKMAPMVEAALAGATRTAEGLTRLEGEIFAWRDGLVLTGSKPELEHNLSAAFRFFLAGSSPFRTD
jgi:hypothetical protein